MNLLISNNKHCKKQISLILILFHSLIILFILIAFFCWEKKPVYFLSHVITVLDYCYCSNIIKHYSIQNATQQICVFLIDSSHVFDVFGLYGCLVQRVRMIFNIMFFNQ